MSKRDWIKCAHSTFIEHLLVEELEDDDVIILGNIEEALDEEDIKEDGFRFLAISNESGNEFTTDSLSEAKRFVVKQCKVK